MLSLILGVVIILLVVFLILWKIYPKREDGFSIMSMFCVMAIIGLLIPICTLSTTVATESTIDSKIAMYEEENTKIEQDIDRIVEHYLKYEQDTFANLKDESPITLVTLFPELKSDALVQQQLEIYVDNNAEIKSLKEEKIDIAKKKYLLYFGK